MMETILQITQYTLPALIVFLTAYLLMKAHYKKEYKLRLLESKLKQTKDVIPAKLQAYERMSLFLERINPTNLVHRMRMPKMSAKELQIALVSAVRQEYEHNLSQQIYVGQDTWIMIKRAKDETVQIINMAHAAMPQEATGTDLSKAIFDYFIKSENEIPSDRALKILKAEFTKTFSL